MLCVQSTNEWTNIMAKAPIKKLTAAQNRKIQPMLEEWHKHVAIVAESNALEKELRAKLVEIAFDGKPEIGAANKVDIGHGCILQCTQPQTLKLDQEALVVLTSDVNNRDNIMPLVDEIISYSPKASMTEWKRLSDEDRLLFHDVVTEHLGTPALKIVRPKQ